MSERLDPTEFLTAYLAEADENVAAAHAHVLSIEEALATGGQHPRAVRELFRVVHTLKGLSAMVGVEDVVEITHRLESNLRAIDAGTIAMARPFVDVVFEALRAIGEVLGALSRGEPPPPLERGLLDRIANVAGLEAPPPAVDGGELELPRALEAKLAPFERDALLAASQTGRRAVSVEFLPSPKKAAAGLTINSVRDRVRSLAEIVKVLPVAVPASEDAPGALCFLLLLVTTAEDVDIATAVGCDLGAVRPLVAATPGSLPARRLDSYLPREEPPFASVETRNVLRVEVTRVDEAMERLGGLIVIRSRLALAVGSLRATGVDTRSLETILQEATRQLRDLRGAIVRLRMIPFSEVLGRLPLVVRGLRRATGKEVQLVTHAADAELDKAVAERVFPALVHLVRNAVDHGVEPPEERRSKGKPVEGRIEIVCSARSNRHLTIVVCDDGRGIDRAAVAHRASGSDVTSDASLLEALCQPGLSTTGKVTRTSGRGMGMDIVRRIVVEQLGGELGLTTREGTGTTFTLRIPLTVSIVEAFTVQCGRERYIVPVGTVDEILEVSPERVSRGAFSEGGRGVVLLERRGETIPLVSLAAILGDRSPAESKQALVVRRGGEPVAFGLDRVITQQETVIRPMVDPLLQVMGVGGAADLGDGRPTVVLDLITLASVAGRAGALAGEAA